MRLSVLIPVVLIFAFTLPTSEALLAQQKRPIAQMIRLEGKVELKSEGKPTYRPARLNEWLFHGDLLRVPKGARGVIRCTSDSTSWTIPADGLPRGVANTCSPTTGV